MVVPLKAIVTICTCHAVNEGHGKTQVRVLVFGYVKGALSSLSKDMREDFQPSTPSAAGAGGIVRTLTVVLSSR